MPTCSNPSTASPLKSTSKPAVKCAVDFEVPAFDDAAADEAHDTREDIEEADANVNAEVDEAAVKSVEAIGRMPRDSRTPMFAGLHESSKNREAAIRFWPQRRRKAAAATEFGDEAGAEADLCSSMQRVTIDPCSGHPRELRVMGATERDAARTSSVRHALACNVS